MEEELENAWSYLLNDTLFRHFTNEEMLELPLKDYFLSCNKGKVIYNEGDYISGFYLIYRGVVKVYKTGIDGKYQILRFAKEGDIIGFRSTITGEKACTTAYALEETDLILIRKEVVLKLIKSNGAFALELLKIACTELGEANDLIKDIAQKTVRERIAEVIIHLKLGFGTDKNHILNIALKREEIANLAGTSTETAIRQLSELKQEGVIGFVGKKIKINDHETLLKIGNM